MQNSDWIAGGDGMVGQEEDVAYANEQAIRLARIRARIREGVWALRDNSALQARWGALECGEAAGKPDADVAAEVTQR